MHTVARLAECQRKPIPVDERGLLLLFGADHCANEAAQLETEKDKKDAFFFTGMWFNRDFLNHALPDANTYNVFLHEVMGPLMAWLFQRSIAIPAGEEGRLRSSRTTQTPAGKKLTRSANKTPRQASA
jgi:hypothetical protein